VTRRHRVAAARPLVFFLATAIALAFPVAALAQSQSGFQYNGIVHVSWWFDEYDSSQALTSRAVLADTGANWMALLVTWYQADAFANVVARHPDPNKDHSDARVRTAIEDAHNRGLQVMLKPHVDALNNAWRGDFNPSNPDAWFQSYTQFIVRYAQIAEEENVEAFVMGTEFKTISGAANRNRWLAVINAVRNVYSGTLTYAANATFPGDEFTSVSFWDQLDLIGLDGYFNLTNLNNPTLQQLIAAWTNNRNGENSVAAVQNFASSRGKPVIFTEIGYKSTDRTNVEPWNFGLSGAVDTAEQRDCYQAAFTVWSQQSAWMRGVFWWAWPVPAPAANDGDYNPRSKPAEQVLRTWQGSAGPNFSLSASPASVTVNSGASGTASIAIARTGGFTGSVDLSASGLPSGVTAAFSPDPTTGNTSTLTLTASGTAAPGTVTVTINGSASLGTRSTSLSLTVNPGANFSLSAGAGGLTLNQGAPATRAITISRSGFTGSVDLSASGLPSGVAAAFSPDPTTGNSSTLTLTASATAATGTANVTISGASTIGTRTTTLAVTINGPNFTLSASPPTLAVNRGASATRAITITRTSFTGAVDLSASGLPAGVTASFSPDPTTGNTSTLTVTASSTATLGTANVTVTGTSGALTRTTTLSLTVNGGGSGGTVTATPVVVNNSPWYRDLAVRLSNPTALTALTVTVVIQRTPGVTYNGMYNTVGGQILQSNTGNTNAATITYIWTLAAGQTLGAGTGWQFSAQAGGNGTAHPTTGDTYTVSYTTGGQSFSVSGAFP
jgi:hypothetical protein